MEDFSLLTQQKDGLGKWSIWRAEKLPKYGDLMHNYVFTCIGILSHYDEYGCVHYKIDYDHHVHHDDTKTAILSRCLAIARQRVLAQPTGPEGVQVCLVVYVHTDGPCVRSTIHPI